MSTQPILISVRQLNPTTWDPYYGQSGQNFITNAAAVAQIIKSTILLFQQEWWENLSIGTPLFQSILGTPTTNQGIALILQQRILSVPFVTAVQNLNVTYAGSTRAFTFSATVLTAFGTVTVTG